MIFINSVSVKAMNVKGYKFEERPEINVTAIKVKR